jgi:hypothetical protein
MTTLTSQQIERAQRLRATGKSLRAIGAALGIAHSVIKRALDQQRPSPRSPSSIEELRKHRITRIKRQNEHLQLSLEKAKGEVVNAADLKAEVLRANQFVKTQLLALPFLLADKLVNLEAPADIQRRLYAAICDCLNDLCYERGQVLPPDYCPYCGHKT